MVMFGRNSLDQRAQFELASSLRKPTEKRVAPAGDQTLSSSMITLGVFLRKHLIAEIRNDALTKSLIGPEWDGLVQPKQSVVLDTRQQGFRILAFPHARPEFLHRKDLRHNDARKCFLSGIFSG
jgi:hypothetical protein